MKPIAVRLEDNVSELLALVAQLEGTTLIDQIRQAIDAHLERKVAEGDLAERATELLANIDQEASAKKAAIGALFEKATEVTPPKTPKGRTLKAVKPPMGFSPPSRSVRDEGDQ
jgi:predicted DNA-binding protein